MPTPSIQTLRADAQQVLNLDSISAVRSVVAATLANANAGTPLNPNLTTQQLWNEFYQIVTQPKSDIESIIANQLMKFLFAPPAPGGAGADKQVIFNDGGVLAGDPQFLWNKTTNLLTVTGSATITGDLTVDTSTLKVDSTNNRVGIGTASPAQKLSLVGDTFVASSFNGAAYGDAAAERLRIGYKDGTPDTGLVPAQIVAQASVLQIATRDIANGTLTFHTGTGVAERYRIDGIGVSTWSISGSTAMTLNSTGLAIGDTAFAGTRLTLRESASQPNALAMTNRNATQTWRIGVDVSAVDDKILGFYDSTSTTFRMQLTDTGNLGLGVTPSTSWPATSKAFQLGASSAIEGRTNDGSRTAVYTNAVWNGTNLIYQNTAPASYYLQSSSVHSWFTAPSGTAGNAITFTQAMTLDASGNLLVGVTSAIASGSSIQNLGSARQVLTLKGNDQTSYTLGVWSASATGDNLFQYFGTETSLTVRGSISYNRGGGLVAYNTTSDYRAKDIIGPVSNSGSLIDSLKVYVGKMKGATIERPMLIAHEAQEVAPYAVTGTKDEVDADGNPKYQQMDVSALVPVLIAEIQSLRARVQTLETR